MKKHIKILAFSLMIVMMSVLMNAGHLYAANNALSFDGTTAFVSIPDAASLQIPTGTWEAWFKLSSFNATDEQPIISKDGPGFNDDGVVAIEASPYNDIVFRINRAGDSSNQVMYSDSAVSLNTWTHVAVTWGAGGMKMYVNGVLQGTGFDTGSANTSPILSAGTDFLIGKRVGSTTTYFNGQIDEVRIWNIAQSQIKINQYKDLTLSGSESGLVAYYQLDEGSGTTTNDLAGGDNNGTITAATWTGSGVPVLYPPGNALSFNGSNTYVAIPDAPSLRLTNQFAIEFWFKSNDLSQSSTYLVDRYNRTAVIYGYVTNQIEFYSVSGGYTGSDPRVGTQIGITDTGWHHIAYSYDGSIWSGYKDGVQIFSSPKSFAITPDTGPLSLGAATTPSNFANCTLDEVRIWNVGRSQPNIQTNMYNTLVGNESGLVAYYRFDQGGGSTLTDYTANNNHGTLSVTPPTWQTSGAMCPFPISATNVSSTGFTANWNAVSGATDYKIDVATDSAFTALVVTDQSVGGAVTSYAVSTALSPGTTYYYRMRAEKGAWTSPNSASVSFMLPPGNALQFNGSPNYVQMNEVNLGTSDFTIEGWIKPNNTGNYVYTNRTGETTAAGNWFTIGVSSNKLTVELADCAASYQAIFGNSILTPNVWYHIAVVRNPTTVTLYVNGVQDGQISDNSSLRNLTSTAGNNVTRFGGNPNQNSGWYNGQIDEFRVWKTALNQTQIQTNMHNTLVGNEINLEAYYKFDQTSGTTLPDITGHGHDGTLSATPPTWQTSGAMCPFPISASNVSTTGFTANWNAVSGATGYRIDVSTDSAFGSFITNGSNIAAGSGTTFNITGLTLTAGTPYYFRMRVEKSGWTSPNSAAVSFLLPPGKALSFNGSGQYVTVPDNANLNFTNTFTLEAWIYKNTTFGGWSGIIRKENYFLVGIQGTDRIRLGFVDTSPVEYDCDSVSNIPNNQWVHVAGVYDGTNLMIYINGVLDKSTNIGSHTVLSGTWPLKLGESSSYYFNGLMDEVRVWNAALSQVQIQSNMYHVLTGSEANLVAYYNFDQTSGTTLPDLSGGDNNGTLVGGPTWTTATWNYGYPYISTGTVSAITGTTASMTGASCASNEVVDIGLSAVTARGVCYSTSADPITPCITEGSGLGTFTSPAAIPSPMTALTPNTLYHFRAYATNSYGTSYGADVPFTTRYVPVIAQASPIAVSMSEDNSPTAWSTPTISATEADGDAMTWSVLTAASHGTASVSGTGASPTITYTLTANYNGADSFVAKVVDADGFANITINLTINAVNDPPVNTVLPSFSGTMAIGQTITANPGTWSDAADGATSITYAYQWQRADNASGTNLVNISGATSSTYILTATDNQKYIRVQITATDNGVGIPATQSVVAYSPYQSMNVAAPVITQGVSVSVTMDEDNSPLAWSTPTITATTAPGITLTWSLAAPASHGTAAVSGTGASPTITYMPAANYNGADSFTAQVSDGLGGTASIVINVTINPINDPPVNTTLPSITGTMSAGQTITANPGVWDDTTDTSVSGSSTISYAYQWQRADDASGTNLVSISGATGSTYTLTAADAQKYIRVQVTAADSGVGTPATQSAAAYSPYQKIGATAPVITQGTSVSVTMDEDNAPLAWSTPTITATSAATGVTLTWTLSTPAGHGTATVSGTGASPTITYAPDANYNGTDSFTAQVSDGLGGTASIVINVTINPINDPPVNTELPSITGTMAIGQILTVTPGIWNDTIDTSVSGSSTISYAYQWQRADDANGTNLADIAGATNSTYMVTSADVQKYFRVKVTATDNGVGLPDTQSVTMTAQPLGIQGRVHDGVKGIANIEVNIFSQKKNFAANPITDVNGNYSVTGLEMSDDYQVSIYSEQFKAEVFYTIPEGETPGVYIPTESAFSADMATLVTPSAAPIKNIDIVVKLVANTTIQGHVYGADGNPIEGVWVNAWSETLTIGSGAYTDADGYYIIYGLEAVSAADAASKGYIVDAMPPDDNSQTYPSKVATGVSGIDFKLKAGFSVSGNVKDMNLKPVSGARVYAASKSYPAQKNGTGFTDSDGYYTVSGLDPASDYIVSASDPNYALQYYNRTSELSNSAPVNLMLSDVQDIDFVLDKGLVIRGTVYVGTTPAAGITVNAQSASLPKFGDAKTDAQGKYEIIGLDQNITDYIISVRQTGYVPAYYASSGTVLIREQADKIAPTAYSQASERNIVLTTGFKISGLITFNGQGLSGITAETISPTTGERTSFISASGSYTLSGLMPGSYDVVFRSTDYEELHKTVVIADKDIALNVSMTAKPLRTVSGTVSGLPMGKTVMISAWSASENKRTSVFVEGSGEAENYTITDLTPLSDYIIEMSSADYPSGYPYQAFKNKLRPDEADWVDLSKGNAGGIDFAIPSGFATVSGTITFPSDVVAGDTAQIAVYSPSRNISLSTQVQTSGSQIVSYAITGLLPASDYIIYISSPKYVDHYYNGTDGGTLHESEATRSDLSKTLNAVINFKLSAGRSLSGRVVDPNKNPKAGLTVELWSKTAGVYETGITSGDGSYLIKGIHPAPDYAVYVTDPAFGVFYYYTPSESVRNQLSASSVSTMNGNVSGIDIIVFPTETISGRITSPKGLPLEFMWVEARSELQQSGAGAFTDENGYYQLTGLSKGSDYTVLARPDWYYPPVEKKPVASGTTGLDFTLDPDQGYTMSGTVKNSSGQLIPKVTIELWSDSRGIKGEIWAVSDHSGKYQLKGLPEASDYKLMISPEKDTPYSFSIVENISLPMSGNASDITLVQGSRITGRVTDKDTGAGITDADVTAIAPGKYFMQQTETGYNGEYAIRNVPSASGGYNITIIKSGYIGQTLTASSDQTLNVVLEKIGAITGTVRDRKTGAPLSGITVEAASISMSGTEHYRGSAITGGDGQYFINGLKNKDSQNTLLNDYTVTVLAPGYPPQSVGAKKVGENVNFYLSKGKENVISGTIADADGTVPYDVDFVAEAFEQNGRFVSSASADKTGKFDIGTLVPEKQYYIKFTAYLGNNPTVSQWADSGNIGLDNPVTDDPPPGTKLYHTDTVVNFKFSKPVKTSSVPPSHSKPAPVQNVKSFTHIIGKVKSSTLRGSAGPDYTPASNNPNPSLTFTLPEGANYYISYNTDPDYTINKRNAPEAPPAGLPDSTGDSLSGDGVFFYAHIASIDERGRIGETITVPIRIDTIPPTNGAASGSASGGTASLKLGASGPDVKEMNISNTGYGKNSEWETRTKEKEWNLSEGDGKKDVFVQFKDQAKNVANYKVSVNKSTPKPPAKPGTPGTGNTTGVYIEKQTFVVDINAPDGTVVGTVIADASSEDIVFTILSGNTGHVFSIDPYTGEIKIANSKLLLNNGTKNYELSVQVSDGTNTMTATVTVQAFDKNKDKLIVADQTFSTDKSFDSGTYIGTVTAFSADTKAILSYHIISGNDDDIFAINTKTGDIVIADAAKLSVKQYVLVVEVSDGKNKATGKITIEVTGGQIFVSNKNFSVEENAAIGTVIGTFTASSGNPEAVLSYRIVSGNTDGVFAIDSATGVISLIGALNYDKASSYTLGIEVSDGKNKASAIVKISVNPVNKETLKGSWTWENPAPTGHTIYGAYGDFAVGESGTILHFDGGNWVVISSGTEKDLKAVFGNFAAGDAGTILNYDGSAWNVMSSGVSENLRALWGIGQSLFFAAGDSGTILHYDGSAWHQAEKITDKNLNGLWGISDSNVFTVGDNGTILHYDGKIWATSDSHTEKNLQGLWGSSPNDVFAVGDAGVILHYDGTAWQEMNSGTAEDLRAVTGTSSDNVFAAGAFGTILHYDGKTWQQMNSGSAEWLNAIAGNFAFGNNGIILKSDGATWLKISQGISSAWFKSVWGISASDMIAVGGRFDYDASRYQNVIYHYSNGKWLEMKSNSSEWLYDVWGRSASDIFAVGWAGTILHYDGTQWMPMTSPTTENLYALAGDASTVIAVGEKGTVLVYDGSAWRVMDSGTTATLYGISGENGIFTSVGGSGTILKYEENTWTYQDSMTAATLYSVWGKSPSDIYAAGDGGTILHYDGKTWTAQRSGGTEKFRSLTGFGNYVFAAGENGVVFYSSGRGWSQLPTGNHRNFMGIWADDRFVSVVGDNGAILRFSMK